MFIFLVELVKYFSDNFHNLFLGDHKTFYWTKGIIENFMKFLKRYLDHTEKHSDNPEQEDEEIIENTTFAIFNLALDNSNNICLKNR